MSGRVEAGLRIRSVPAQRPSCEQWFRCGGRGRGRDGGLLAPIGVRRSRIPSAKRAKPDPGRTHKDEGGYSSTSPSDSSTSRMDQDSKPRSSACRTDPMRLPCDSRTRSTRGAIWRRARKPGHTLGAARCRSPNRMQSDRHATRLKRAPPSRRPSAPEAAAARLQTAAAPPASRRAASPRWRQRSQPRSPQRLRRGSAEYACADRPRRRPRR